MSEKALTELTPALKKALAADSAFELAKEELKHLKEAQKRAWKLVKDLTREMATPGLFNQEK
jgi:choline kinase